MLVSLNGNPRITILSVYSPTEAATNEVVEEFHHDLRGAINDVPAHHLLMVLGDLNAHLAKVDSDDSPKNFLHCYSREKNTVGSGASSQDHFWDISDILFSKINNCDHESYENFMSDNPIIAKYKGINVT